MRGASLVALYASVAVSAVVAVAPSVMAGGFALREQSAQFQGTSFAGDAAGGALSSMYWNSAATATKAGMNFESSYSVIDPRVDVTVTGWKGSGKGLSLFYPSNADGIAGLALVPSTYANYQISSDLFLGLAINSGFGLATEPNNETYKGAILAMTTRLTTYNLNPTIAYKVMPGVTVGVGAQIEYGRGTLRFATGLPAPHAPAPAPAGQTTSFEGDGFGFGATAGVMLDPVAGTTIGIGYRSQMNQHLEGRFYTTKTAFDTGAEADIKLPDIVTISLRQVVTPTTRLLGTLEWTNWSRFTDLTLTATEGGKTVLKPTGVKAGGTIASLPEGWHDGWFMSIGGEYDYSDKLTLRTGFAYEISPVRNPEERSPGIPDADRYWLSTGLSWKAFDNVTFDFAYSHIFVKDSNFIRETANKATTLSGTVGASTDIISASVKTKW